VGEGGAASVAHETPSPALVGPVWRKPVTTIGTRFPPESRVNPPVESIAAGEKAGVASDPRLGYNCPQCGQFPRTEADAFSEGT
jgi:hypothetical protein